MIVIDSISFIYFILRCFFCYGTTCMQLNNYFWHENNHMNNKIFQLPFFYFLSYLFLCIQNRKKRRYSLLTNYNENVFGHKLMRISLIINLVTRTTILWLLFWLKKYLKMWISRCRQRKHIYLFTLLIIIVIRMDIYNRN